MERRQDGLPANIVRNRGQRGRNPPWYCNCPDCRRGFSRPHVFRRGQVNGLHNVRLRVLSLRNVRLRVLRQNQRRVAQRVAGSDNVCLAPSLGATRPRVPAASSVNAHHLPHATKVATHDPPCPSRTFLKRGPAGALCGSCVATCVACGKW